MLKPETVQILKRDGYTDKQITAMDYLVRCAEISAKDDTKMTAYSCRPFPSMGQFGWIGASTHLPLFRMLETVCMRSMLVNM